MYHDNLTANQAAVCAEIMAARATEYGGFHANTATDAARIARQCAANGDTRGARNCLRTAAAATGRAASNECPDVWALYVLSVELKGGV